MSRASWLIAALFAALVVAPGPSRAQADWHDTESESPQYTPSLAAPQALFSAQARKGSGKTRTQVLRFLPLDSNNHNTVLFFYNAGSSAASVTLDFEDETGVVCGSGTSFDIPPRGTMRVSADSLDAGRPASWANTVVYNIFDTCEVGFITMPSRGVEVNGFVAWTATDVYNPRDLNPHAPIVFTRLKRR